MARGVQAESDPVVDSHSGSCKSKARLAAHLAAHAVADGDTNAVVGAQQHARLRQRRCSSIQDFVSDIAVSACRWELFSEHADAVGGALQHARLRQRRCIK